MPYDTGNVLLGETPAELACTVVPTGDGQRLAVTIRTASTTLTVLLSKQDARLWAGAIKGNADKMSSLIAATSGLAQAGG